MRWTGPSGRTYTTRPTKYQLLRKFALAGDPDLDLSVGSGVLTVAVIGRFSPLTPTLRQPDRGHARRTWLFVPWAVTGRRWAMTSAPEPAFR
jgi:hypothetical protein